MLTIKEVARRLDCSDDSVIRLLDAGALAGVDIRASGGGRKAQWRISEAELARFVEARTMRVTRAKPDDEPEPNGKQVA